MPIEIKELHIRVTIDATNAAGAAKQTPEDSRDAIVAECVEQVLQILRNKGER